MIYSMALCVLMFFAFSLALSYRKRNAAFIYADVFLNIAVFISRLYVAYNGESIKGVLGEICAEYNVFLYDGLSRMTDNVSAIILGGVAHSFAGVVITMVSCYVCTVVGLFLGIDLQSVRGEYDK